MEREREKRKRLWPEHRHQAPVSLCSPSPVLTGGFTEGQEKPRPAPCKPRAGFGAVLPRLARHSRSALPSSALPQWQELPPPRGAGLYPFLVSFASI